MKKLALALVFCLWSGLAFGQCSGVFPANTICGNNTASPAVPTAVTFGGAVAGPGSSTVGHFATWNNTIGTLLSDFDLFGTSNTFTAGQTFSGTNTFSGANTFSNTNTFSSTFKLTGLSAGTQTSCLGLDSSNNVVPLTGQCNATGQSSVTANYSIATTDCGTVVMAGTGSTGQFTVTLPAASGFTAGCLVTLKNGDTGRGKILSGFPTDVNTTLWPGLVVAVQKIGSAWVTVAQPTYWIQTSSAPFFVNTSTGHDSTNDCLNSAAPCLTVSRAMTIITKQVVFNGGPATINITGNVTEQASCTSAIPGAFPTVNIVGDVGTPHNVKWTPPNAAVGIIALNGCNVDVNGVWFSSAGTPCAYIDAISGGAISIEAAVDFGLLNGTAGCGEHILVGAGGRVNLLGNYTISGNMTYHALLVGPSILQHIESNINMPNALTFTDFYNISGPGNINYDQTTTCTGAGCAAGSTGSKFLIVTGGSMSTNSSVIPGATAGIVNGGCVDTTCGGVAQKFATSVLSGLPTCNASNAGTVGFIVDSTTATWGAAITGGGGNSVLATCDGVNYTVTGL